MAYFSKSREHLNPYQVGNRIYGGSRSFPNIGPSDPLGYRERDLRATARRSAILRRLKAKQGRRFMSADFLREV